MEQVIKQIYSLIQGFSEEEKMLNLILYIEAAMELYLSLVSQLLKVPLYQSN